MVTKKKEKYTKPAILNLEVEPEGIVLAIAAGCGIGIGIVWGWLWLWPRPPGGGGCFVRNTKVQTGQESSRPIQKLRKGDFVLSQDPATAALTEACVEKTFEAWENEFIVIEVGEERVVCTPLHKFYTQEGWEQARYLRQGDKIQSITGGWKDVTKIGMRQTVRRRVFNLHVDRTHCYFVGQGGLLVHNTWEKMGLPSKEDER